MIAENLKIKTDWLSSPPVVQVVEALGFENVKFVGGAVRDSIAGRPVADIDAATIHQPVDVIRILKSKNIKVIPTGLDHGTVTAVIQQQHVEITTLRIDVETDGRHAEVAYTDSWLEDAKRRDFTMNAIYCDGEGNIYDPFGGIKDIEDGRVRFIGEADARIKEDALRIMRFFRFTARYSKGEIDQNGMNACKNLLSMLEHLSVERVRDELLKLMAWKTPEQVIHWMHEVGIFELLFGDKWSLNPIVKYLQQESKYCAEISSLHRFFFLTSMQSAVDTARKFKLSNVEKKVLARLENACGNASFSTEVNIRKSVYCYGASAVIAAVLYKSAEQYSDVCAVCEKWLVPVFPVQGRDLIDQGVEVGPLLGAKLKELENTWVSSDFKLLKEELLKL